MDLMDKMTALLTAMGNPVDQAQHDAEVAQLKQDIVQAKEDLAAEDVRMTAGGFGRSSSADSVTGFPAYDGSERVE